MTTMMTVTGTGSENARSLPRMVGPHHGTAPENPMSYTLNRTNLSELLTDDELYELANRAIDLSQEGKSSGTIDEYTYSVDHHGRVTLELTGD